MFGFLLTVMLHTPAQPPPLPTPANTEEEKPTDLTEGDRKDS